MKKSGQRTTWALVLVGAMLMGHSSTGWCQNPPPGMPLPPMKKDERVVKAQQHAKAAEDEAAKAKAEAAELRRQLAEAKKQAVQADAAKVGRSDTSAVAINTGSPSYAPLSVFRDKLLDGNPGPEMVVIPAGEFDMGSNVFYDNEMPIHKVRIGKPFALGKTEVTQKQWRQVMGGDPPELRFKGCDDCPVENVIWGNVQEFIKKLNGLTGKQYRLPSETEWEYAAKAGGSYKYAGSNDIDAVAWYEKNSGGKTHPVGQKKPNAWGLHDMSGNVWEWLEDCWSENYAGNQPADEKTRTVGDCRRWVVRGGSWYLTPLSARSANRGGDDSSVRGGFFGFRLARMLP